MRREHKGSTYLGEWFPLGGGFVASVNTQRRRNGVRPAPRFIVLCPLGKHSVRGFRRTLCAGDIEPSGEARVTHGVLSDELRSALQSSDAFLKIVGNPRAFPSVAPVTTGATPGRTRRPE